LLPIISVSQENLILGHCSLSNVFHRSGAGISKLDSMTAAKGVLMANCKDITFVGHKWPWRLIVMDRKVPDEEEKKNPTKKKPLRVALAHSWSTHTHF